MIDLPMIPYIFFICILLSGILIGAIRGWKATLFFSLGQIISISILIGIYFAVSDSVIGLFRGWWTAKLEVSEMNYTQILQLMKVPCGAVFVSVFLLPMNLILWLFYLIFKKRINKYMEPDITEITQNSREVIPKSKLTTRIIGGMLGSIASFSVGSVVASGATFAFVKTDKMNWFTNMTDSVSSASTFGQYQNTKSFKYVYDYMPILQKKKYIDNFIKLFSFTDSNGFNLSNQTLEEISAVNKQNHKLTERVYGSFDASHAIISTILSKSPGTIEVIQDAVPMGNKGDRVAQDLKLFISSKHSNMNFAIHNPKIFSVIKEALQKNFQSFSTTIWYKNYENILQVIKTLESELKKSVDEFQSRKAKLRINISQREHNISAILTNHSKEQNLTNYSIPKQKQVIKTWESNKIAASSELNIARSNFTSFKNGDWRAVLGKWESYKNNVNIKNQRISSLKQDLHSAQNTLSSNQQEKVKLENVINIATNQISNLNNMVNSLARQISSKERKKQDLVSQLIQPKADANFIRAQIAALDKQIGDLKATKTNQEFQLLNKQQELSVAKSQKSNVEYNIKTSKGTISSKQIQLTKAKRDLFDANKVVSTYKPIYDLKKRELDIKKNLFDNSQNHFNQVDDHVSSEKAQLSKLLDEKNTAIQNIAKAKRDFLSMNQAISNLANGISQLVDTEFKNIQLKDIDLNRFIMRDSFPLEIIGSKFPPTSKSASVRFQEVDKIGRINNLKTKNLKKDELKKIKDSRFKNYQENKEIILQQFIKLFKN